MKDRYTLRGVVLDANTSKLIFNSPEDNIGWIVESFYVWSWNMDANLYSAGKLVKGSVTNISFTNSDVQDSRVIAWSQTSGGVAESSAINIIDPQHLITNELYVVNLSGQAISYLVNLKRVQITNDQEIMSIIKERQQNV